jgi:hypothetical protein
MYGVLPCCRGITRPHALNFAAATSSTVFSHVCLRKLYVLCSRGGSLQGSQKHLLQIAQVSRRCITIVPLLPSCTSRRLIVHLMLKSLLLHSQAAFPIILVRCRSILQQFAADQRADPGSVDSLRMEEVVCVLEVHQRHYVKLSAINALLHTKLFDLLTVFACTF